MKIKKKIEGGGGRGRGGGIGAGGVGVRSGVGEVARFRVGG